MRLVGVDPFTALGIEKPAPPSTVMQPGPDGGDIPMMRIRPEKAGVDPFSALGIEPGQQFSPVAAPVKNDYPVPSGKMTGYRANVGAGIKNAAIGLVSMIPDAAANLVMGPKQKTEYDAQGNYVRTRYEHSEPFRHALEWLGGSPSDVVPGSLGQDLVRAGAEGAANVVMGGPLFGSGGAAKSAPSLARAGASLIPEAAIGAGGGVAGKAAEHAAPEPLKPFANLAGNIAGGVATGGAQMLGGKVFRSANDYVGGLGVGPKEEISGVRVTGPQRRAATGMVNEALGPEGTSALATSGAIEARAKQLQAILDDPAARAAERISATDELANLRQHREEMVPGYQPTVAQVAPTPGTKALDKVSRTTHDATFGARDEANVAATRDYLHGQAPEGAEPATIGKFFTSQLDALETAGEKAIADARTAGEANIAATEASGQQAVRAARQGVQQSAEGLGGMGTPDAHGEALRGTLSTLEDAAKVRARGLWQAVDPDGTLALPLGSVQETARGLLRDLNPNLGDAVAAHESQILSGAAALPDVVPFRDAQRLRTNIGNVERTLRATPGNEQSLRRLGILKSSLDDAIANGAEVAAAADSSVAGRIAAFIRGEGGGPVGGGSGGQGVATGARTGTAGVAGESGEALPARSGSAPGNRGVASESATGHLPADLTELEQGIYADLAPKPRVSEPGIEPSFDTEAARRYADARQATLEQKQTFGQGAIGRTLRAGPRGAEFAIEEAAVPRQFLTGKATEPARVQQYIEAVGGLPQAVTNMREALVNDLRNQRTRVIMDDGTVSPKGLADWMRNHGRTIDLFPGLREQLNTVERMQGAYDTATATAKQSLADANKTAAADLAARTTENKTVLRDFERGPGGKFVGPEPADAFKKVMASDTRTQDFADIVAAARGKPEVIDGLKRLAVEHMEGMGQDVLRKFIERRRGPLKEIFGGQGLQNLEAVGAVIKRGQLAQAKPAVPNSDTAQKQNAIMKHLGPASRHGFGGTALALIGEHLMESFGHGTGISQPILAGIGLGAGAGMHFLRQVGITTRNDLVREMMLNPALTRELQARLTNGQITPLNMRRIASAALTGTSVGEMQRKDRK